MQTMQTIFWLSKFFALTESNADAMTATELQLRWELSVY